MITHDKLMQLYASKEGSVIRAMVAEEVLHHRQQQLLDLHTLSAGERYAQLVSQRPDLALQTPQKHLASYLGIVPESLSRIRKEMAKSSKLKN
jgi:CRP-like cAMP-binding protein